MSIFSKIGGLKPKLTAFNLSHSVTIDCNFGELVPVDCYETLPGDVFKFNADVIGRLTSALKSPILSQMDIVLEAFYCPSRLLMGRDSNFDTPPGEVTFEEFISGGKSGAYIGKDSYPLPRFLNEHQQPYAFKECGIADYLGAQTNVKVPYADSPVAFPWRAYRWIWNSYYRDENLMDPVQECAYLGTGESSDLTLVPPDEYDKLLYRCWRKDYFTSALPFQQRGTSPALPISGVVPVTATGGGDINVTTNYKFWMEPLTNAKTNLKSDETGFIRVVNGEALGHAYDKFDMTIPAGAGVIDLNNAATFDVNQIRVAFQVQKWLERNARGGVRYTEYLKSHFGIAPSDARLQRPQFIGSCRSPWLVNEVLQTSETNSSVTPQGNQAGQAINLSRNNLGKFRCYEYGYILVLASVVPKAIYQQGIPKYLSRRYNLDFYSPEFSHLSEQPVYNKEIYYKEGGDNNGIFGFQPIWNELRFIPSRVCGHMKTGANGYSFDYWHFGRYFADTPKLSEDFLAIGKTASSKQELMRVFAVQDENPFVIDIGFNITALRPLPYLSEPGFIDHF